MPESDNEKQLLWNSPLGMQRQQEMLTAAHARGRLAQTLLFHGERGYGSEALAISLMRTLLCARQSDTPCDLCPNCLQSGDLAHPDLKVIFPLPATRGDSDSSSDQVQEQFSHLIRREMAAKSSNYYHQMQVENGRAILIDQIRSLRRFASMKSYEGGNRVALLFDAHLMNHSAQNALLKLAEEPPTNLYLVLVTDQPNALLPTIISRCQALFIPPQTQTAIEGALTANAVPEEKASRLARLAGGDLGKAINMLQEEEESIEEAISFLRLVLGPDSAGLAKFLIELTRNRDRNGSRQLLTQLIAWLRDVQLRELSSEPDRWVRFQETQEVLDRFTAAYDVGPPGDLITLLEDYIDRIDKNLYLNSLLYALVFDLRSRIRRKPADSTDA